MNNIYIFILVLLSLALIYKFYNERKFYIGKENNDILTYLKKIDHSNNISILKIREIEEKKLVMFKEDNNLGVLILGKSKDGNYKVEQVKYEKSTIGLDIYNIKNEGYVLLYGYNGNNKIKKISFKIKEKNQVLKIYDEEYFLRVWPMSENEKESDFKILLAYDQWGKDITDNLDCIIIEKEERDNIIFSN